MMMNYLAIIGLVVILLVGIIFFIILVWLKNVSFPNPGIICPSSQYPTVWVKIHLINKKQEHFVCVAVINVLRLLWLLQAGLEKANEINAEINKHWRHVSEHYANYDLESFPSCAEVEIWFNEYNGIKKIRFLRVEQLGEPYISYFHRDVKKYQYTVLIKSS